MLGKPEIPEKSPNPELTSTPFSLSMPRTPTDPPSGGDRNTPKKLRAPSRRNRMQSGGGSKGRCQQREAGPKRNPPLRTRSYPPTGRGAWRSSQSLKPLEALRSNGTKLSQWAAALQAAGPRSGKSYPCLWLAKVGARLWLAVIPLRPGLHPTEIRPQPTRAWRVGQADGGGDGSARSLGVGGRRGQPAFCEVNRLSLPLRVRSSDRLHHHGAGGAFQMWTSLLTLEPLCRKSSGEP